MPPYFVGKQTSLPHISTKAITLLSSGFKHNRVPSIISLICLRRRRATAGDLITPHVSVRSKNCRFEPLVAVTGGTTYHSWPARTSRARQRRQHRQLGRRERQHTRADSFILAAD